MEKPKELITAAQTQNEDMVFSAVKKLVLDSLTTENSKASYSRSIDGFLKFYTQVWRAGLNKACVNAYKSYLVERGYSPATVNVRLAAIRRLSFEAADSGYLPGEIAEIGRAHV